MSEHQLSELTVFIATGCAVRHMELAMASATCHMLLRVPAFVSESISAATWLLDTITTLILDNVVCRAVCREGQLRDKRRVS